MREVLLLALAGAVGTVVRYGLSGWAYRTLGERFAYGTLGVNVIGCLLLGFLMHVGLTADLVSRSTRLALGVGFLGAFTTFSTFSYETIRYLEEGSWSLAAINVGASLGLGLLAAWLGIVLGRAALGGA